MSRQKLAEEKRRILGEHVRNLQLSEIATTVKVGEQGSEFHMA